jgi:hypothetical protein
MSMIRGRGDGVSTDTGWSTGSGGGSHSQVKLIPLNLLQVFQDRVRPDRVWSLDACPLKPLVQAMPLCLFPLSCLPQRMIESGWSPGTA